MFFDYLFISQRYNRFAEEADWVTQLLFRHNHNTQTLPMRKKIQQYLTYSEDMAYKLFNFNKKIHVFSEWIKSFFPGTLAFQARHDLANQLTTSNNLYLTITLKYCKYTKEKAANKDLLKQSIEVNKRLNKQPKITQTLRPQQQFLNLSKESKAVPTFGLWGR